MTNKNFLKKKKMRLHCVVQSPSIYIYIGGKQMVNQLLLT